MSIVIPSKNIYGNIQHKIIRDNKITRVDSSYVVNKKEVDPIYENTFLVYSYSGNTPPESISNYTNELNNNTPQPYSTNIAKTHTYSTMYYSYFKIENISVTSGQMLREMTLSLVEDYVRRLGTNYTKRYKISATLPLGKVTNDYAFKEYNSVADFEAEYVTGNEYVKSMAVGIIDNTTTITLCIFIRQYIDYSSQNIYNYISQNFSVSVQPAILYTKTYDSSKGDGENSFLFADNELRVYDEDPDNDTSEMQVDFILGEYKNGKETAKITCSISDYYIYGSTQLAITRENEGSAATLPMTFNIGDSVIPYRLGKENGEQKDVPLSKYANGQPKEFIVTGVDFSYVGILRQILTLQEIVYD